MIENLIIGAVCLAVGGLLGLEFRRREVAAARARLSEVQDTLAQISASYWRIYSFVISDRKKREIEAEMNDVGFHERMDRLASLYGVVPPKQPRSRVRKPKIVA